MIAFEANIETVQCRCKIMKTTLLIYSILDLLAIAIRVHIDVCMRKVKTITNGKLYM